MSDTPTQPTTTTSPLAEADPRSLDELFSSRPPYDPAALRGLVAELRRMRLKWQSDEAEGKAKRSARASSATRVTSAALYLPLSNST